MQSDPPTPDVILIKDSDDESSMQVDQPHDQPDVASDAESMVQPDPPSEGVTNEPIQEADDGQFSDAYDDWGPFEWNPSRVITLPTPMELGYREDPDIPNEEHYDNYIDGLQDFYQKKYLDEARQQSKCEHSWQQQVKLNTDPKPAVNVIGSHMMPMPNPTNFCHNFGDQISTRWPRIPDYLSNFQTSVKEPPPDLSLYDDHNKQGITQAIQTLLYTLDRMEISGAAYQ